ncbi:MAG: sulfur transferase domain-containing protein, partial [Algisphaera sp.]
MNKPLLAIVVALAATSFVGCQSTHGNRSKTISADQLEPYECGTITRVHTFGSIFLASQPKPEDFEQAKDFGVKTVLNIRHESEITDFNEPKLVTDLGMTYINLPWKKTSELTDAVFEKTSHILNTSERPILFHCSSANRVGAVWIPWRVFEGGLDIEDAVAEAKTIGLRSPALEQR